MKNKKIKKCRLCSNSSLKILKNFGDFYISNFVNKNKIKSSKKAPLNLVKCTKCKLVQLEHTAPMELMYTGYYWYRSGVTKTMIDQLKEISLIAKKYTKNIDKPTILDIGANDGTYLKNFSKNKYHTIGVEPAKNMAQSLKKNCSLSINDFWNINSLKNNLKTKNARVSDFTTALGMFYDLEEPNKFIKDIALSLKPNGIFVAQLMCLKSMLEKNDFGNICHEHLEYYSYETLKFMYENNGLEIFKVEENEINAGSYRIYARLSSGKGSISYKENVSNKRIKKFIDDIEKSKKSTVNFIKKEVSKGKKVYVYGASTKGNTILQYFELDSNLIPFAADRSPEKWGKYTVGTGIKIISENEARKLKPDYFLVLPWGFIEEFRKREKNFLNKGGKFILPFPKFRLIDK